MLIREVVTNRALIDDLADPVNIPTPDLAKPVVLSPTQQAKAVDKARKQKIINLIIAKQASERKTALNDISNHDKEIAYIN